MKKPPGWEKKQQRREQQKTQKRFEGLLARMGLDSASVVQLDDDTDFQEVARRLREAVKDGEAAP